MSTHHHVDIAPDGVPTVYLLFAGFHGQDRRGTDDLVATLASPREANEAFRQVRLQLPNRDGWAELTSVSAAGVVKHLAWFGRNRSLRKSPAAWAVASGNWSVPNTDSTSSSRKWLRRRRGAPTLPVPNVVALVRGEVR